MLLFLFITKDTDYIPLNTFKKDHGLAASKTKSQLTNTLRTVRVLSKYMNLLSRVTAYLAKCTAEYFIRNTWKRQDSSIIVHSMASRI